MVSHFSMVLVNNFIQKQILTHSAWDLWDNFYNPDQIRWDKNEISDCLVVPELEI